ncbi:TPA: hypothetical protein ACGO39_000353 [Streptococcus suis]|uniref:hypothetical protein n=1 Tax=Streptococcus suis TaxID=1307 RepID=UPI000CF4DE41
MHTTYRKTGYSAANALNYIAQDRPAYSLSTELEPQVRFEDKRPTDEIIAYKAWFVQEGLPPFTVKFNHKIKLPTFMTPITFDNLQACEVRYQVYFRADDISEG